MSQKDAHLGFCIPVVTAIITDLEVTDKDHGVMKMKRDLKDAMVNKFHYMEYDENYTLATFLDPRFKWRFFRYVILKF